MLTKCLSYGGGWQSVAMCVLVRTGQLERPDLIVIADTGREVQTTWDYMHNVMQPYLAPIGLKIEIAPHSLARVDLYAPDGTTLVPAFTSEGRLASYCSGEWKRDTLERWLRLQGVKEAEQWIGYSIDELRRIPRKDHRPWLKNRYPLIDLFINRAMCRTLIQEAGLPMPHKSRCWCGQHQQPDEWREVQSRQGEWAKAVAVDEEIRAKDPEQSGLYLFSGRVPLAMADFSGESTNVRLCEAATCYT